MGVFYAGKSGSVQLASTVYKFSKWTLEITSDIVDTTNFASGGQKENISGLSYSKITCEGPYETGAMAITAGGSYAFTLTVGGSVTFAITARVSSIKVDTDATGNKAASISITAESNGAFTAGTT